MHPRHKDLVYHFLLTWDSEAATCSICDATSNPNYVEGLELPRVPIDFFCYACLDLRLARLDSNPRSSYIPLTEEEEVELELTVEDIAARKPSLFSHRDNFRLARSNNLRQVAFFNYRRSQGCCGSFNEQVVLDGENFLLGWNYGH